MSSIEYHENEINELQYNWTGMCEDPEAEIALQVEQIKYLREVNANAAG